MRELLSQKQIKYIKSKKLVDKLPLQEFYDYLYSIWYYDKNVFMDIFLEHWKENPATGEIVESGRLHKKVDDAYDTKKNLCLILPRWFAKTTRILVNLLHTLVYGEREDIGYLASGDLWMTSIGRIRVELETNELLTEVFGVLCPQDAESQKIKKLRKRKQQLLQLTNWNSIETLSSWQRIRWKRKRKWIIDDPDEDRDSRAKKLSFRKFVFSTIYNTMMPWWYIVTIWTIVWPDCFVLYLKHEKQRNTLQYRAIENWKSIRPEMRPLHALMERKEKLWTPIFNQEFMHIPLSNEDALVQLDWIKRRTTLPKFERTVLSVDPARKAKESSDYTGIVYGGIAWWKFYVIRSKQVKLSQMKLESYIEMLIAKLNPDFILKEDNIEIWLTERLASKWHKIVWVTVHTDKRARLLDTSPYIEKWEVFFPVEWSEDLIHQICNYPHVMNDDIMDAFTQFIANWMTVTNSDLFVI